MRLNEKLKYRLRQKSYRKLSFKKITNHITHGFDDIEAFLNENGKRKKGR